MRLINLGLRILFSFESVRERERERNDSYSSVEPAYILIRLESSLSDVSGGAAVVTKIMAVAGASI